MAVIDTSLLIERMNEGKKIDEKICIISVVEHPTILEYAKFQGKVLYPDLTDFELALDLQRRLRRIGKMKGASDLIIAATCMNAGESLLTSDQDFEEISNVSDLKVVWE